ncbi:MAG: phosphoglycerate dehydrogenase [Lentilactobacillus diolivorans]|jgi:D-3-phosphoglycerate dehydrogenase|uniref:D-3-phosphoglycerate dehydrogenase n=2 Tax=Lentilactobacillus diolivorans TaxID=179838 RepID=A0A0R1SC94_9LACO|nr:phosphoglycerate dehydrogenase [Lentilactobacillus diolivorans]KRL64884.1 D-3-phosphoglycerate dehydrogenase [Lentilactobacillus diolivorans DSM 14421]MCH4165413.1 phosphoglycerate dehydrogenase [Lentilactobacillus diolivorans]RRG02866.1 MAG: 3-phosphoglycerate dehydrogenase [Lactobacillus sp.]GEP23899.1 D-3-phosphoglycerate dehydrogenase [Lentilactobacillus diolivorans]
MYQVKTYNAIAQAGLDQFTDQYQINQTDDADAYLIRSVNLHKETLPKTLKVIARAGAGFNNIPLDRATENGTAVFNTPGSNANAVKELIVSLLVASSRNLFAAAAYAAQNSGADISLRTEHDKTKFKGTELTGRTLAVIGVGHVGSLVANAASALGMNVIGYDPYLSADAAWHISTTITRARTLAEAISNADYVTVHVPKNEETTGLIGKEQLAIMKDGVRLFNYSRGGIVDNQAVIKALDAHRVQTYMTDFGDNILLNRDDVIVTPHIGGSTQEAEVNGATQGARTIMTYLETGNITNSVNLPNLQVPFQTPYRVTLIHKNIPNMVGQIATALANAGINIEGMSNAARENVAYTIIDLENLKNEEDNALIARLSKIDAVFRVRVLKK